ncbi:MAG: phosphomannomutase/phosphoglucomutase [Parcubacteria group bacterium]|nr:phosphomannomutase/phosphoglucomutase [Parcubacteria group bacterium]
MNESIFKSYDIRGIYPTEIDEHTAYAIGRALVEYLNAKNIAIGRDARTSSPALFAALAKGITEAGCNVLDLGLATTPMVYFASHQSGVDGSVSLTASHNPPEYNGFKLTRKDAVPIGGNSGMTEIKERAMAGNFKKLLLTGNIIPLALADRYLKHFSGFWKLGDKKFSIVVDTANAMGVLELPFYRALPQNIELVVLYDDLAHPFQAHEANPLKTETLDELRKKVVEIGAHLGIAYDGDADRIGFVDETGAVVPMDLMTAILARPVLERYPEGTIFYDLRSSMSVKEIIEANGGKALECMVGHANIKKQMRDEDAAFAGELSGHYYFRENSYAEASTLAAIFLLNYLAETGKKLSELVAEVKKYFHSGEINSTVQDAPAIVAKLKEKYKDGTLTEQDGIKISFPDWWFNVRSSNTEPLLRLNLEAKTEAMMMEKRDELLALIRG